MSDKSEEQAAWAADLENQISLLKAAVAPDTPGEWLAGVLERGLAATHGEVTGYTAPSPHEPTFNSITWCQSRFVCITMQCYGSSWCAAGGVA